MWYYASSICVVYGSIEACRSIESGTTSKEKEIFQKEKILKKKGLLSRDRKSSEQFACFNRRYHEMKAEWGRSGIVPAMRSDTNQEEAL